jgi:hypothetical protein
MEIPMAKKPKLLADLSRHPEGCLLNKILKTLPKMAMAAQSKDKRRHQAGVVQVMKPSRLAGSFRDFLIHRHMIGSLRIGQAAFSVTRVIIVQIAPIVFPPGAGGEG